MTIIGKLQNKPKAAIELWGRIKGHTVGKSQRKARVREKTCKFGVEEH